MNDEWADEQALVRQLVQGNLRAYQVLVERYQRLVLHMVGRVIQQPEDVEDVCQEVFIKVYKHLPEYQFEAKLSTWIATIAYRTALNFAKKESRQSAQLLPETDEDSGWLTPEEVLVHQDWKTFLHAQIAKLPVHYRTVLTLYHLDELSYDEIGQAMSMPAGTVKNYLFRARKLLKEGLLQFKNKEHWL